MDVLKYLKMYNIIYDIIIVLLGFSRLKIKFGAQD